MRFQPRVATRTTQDRIYQALLRGPVWRGEARARTVLLYRGAQHLDAARARRRETEGSKTFPPAVSIRALVEGVASTEGREHPSGAECYVYRLF